MFVSRFLGSARARSSSVSPAPLRGRKLIAEKLWRDFFSDPSQWWDHRSEKLNPKFPDFKHKKTQQSLWVVDNLTPPWVKTGLATMVPGLVQSHWFSWNVKIRRHVKAGDDEMALNLFQQMQREGILPDKFTFISVLNACSNLRSLEEGRRVHTQIIQRGCETDVYVANCLVDMYAKCGSVKDALSVFCNMQQHDVFSWGVMIAGCVQYGQGLKTQELFQKMQQEGLEPNPITFVAVLNACANVPTLEEGRHVHEQVIRSDCESDLYVATSLVDMYAKCGSIEDAWSVFKKMRGHDLVSWNAMIGGYVKSEQGRKAMELYWKMQQEGVEPDAVTFVGILTACASLAALDEGTRVHEQIIQRGWESNIYVATCLLDMYAKCGRTEDAWNVFNKMRKRDVVSWNAMIAGSLKSGHSWKAIALYSKMKQEQVQPDAATFVGVLNACASVAALEEGRHVHEQIIQAGCESDLCVANCLVDMYAKCGCIDDAWIMFTEMREHDLVSWSTMIGGYAMHGHANKAIKLFKQMSKGGVEISGVTFISLLSACSHGGLVKEGLRYFKSLTSCYDLFPTIEHYACMVDLLGRAGQLEEAEKMAEKLPMEKKGPVWMSLLGACRIHGNIQMAERAAVRF